MSLQDVLRSFGAPDELVAAIENADSFEAAWDTCRRGDLRLWLAASSGVPIEAVIEASAAVVLTIADEHGVGHAGRTTELAVAGALDQLEDAIVACEALADAGNTTYRDSRSRTESLVARAALLIAAAAQSLAEGEARLEADRLERARRSAALLGAGTSITLAPPMDHPRLIPNRAADPAQGSFLFAVAAAAEALDHCAQALEPAVAADLDAIVREVLDAVVDA